jgi:hypothetical protein
MGTHILEEYDVSIFRATSTLKTEALHSPEILVPIYKTTQNVAIYLQNSMVSLNRFAQAVTLLIFIQEGTGLSLS